MKLLLIPPIAQQKQYSSEGWKTEVKYFTRAPPLISGETKVQSEIVWLQSQCSVYHSSTQSGRGACMCTEHISFCHHSGLKHYSLQVAKDLPCDHKTRVQENLQILQSVEQTYLFVTTSYLWIFFLCCSQDSHETCSVVQSQIHFQPHYLVDV